MITSRSPRRNMQQRVLQNTGADGRKQTVTVHEPIDPTRPVIFKNHGYIAKAGGYYQPKGITR